VVAQAVRAKGAPGQWYGWALALVVPLAVLLTLVKFPQYDPMLRMPVPHFIIISLVGLAGAALAAMTGVVAERSEDGRVLFLSLAFFTISGFFFIHGFLTPNVLIGGVTSGEGWTTLVGLLGGALFLALSVLRPRPQLRWPLGKFRRGLYVLVLLSMVMGLVISIAYPNAIILSGGYDAAYGQPVEAALWSMTIVTIGLLAFAARRYIQEFRLARLRIQSSVTYGILFLIDAQVGLALSEVWSLAWWVYHGLVLAGLATILVAIVTELGRGATVAESIQGLFLLGTVAKLERSYNETIGGLIGSVEARDPSTQGHSLRVAQIATLIGEAMHLSPEDLHKLHQAGELHDVGKIGVPDAILNKPGPLTDEEFAVIQRHTVKGEAMIRTIPSLSASLPGIRSHHERWDGSGYPDGLAGEAIPLQGRILAVADVYDAMMSIRAYRPAHQLDTVLRELRDGAGVRYDPDVIEAFFWAEVWRSAPTSRSPANA